jgi:hypothetical protein
MFGKHGGIFGFGNNGKNNGPNDGHDEEEEDEEDDEDEVEQTPQEIASEAVYSLLTFGRARSAVDRAHELGELIVPYIYDALDRYEELVSPNPGHAMFRSGTPLSGLCAGIEHFPSMVVVEKLLRFLDSDDKELADSAAEGIAATGLLQAADYIRQLLRSSEPSRVIATFSGLSQACEAGRIEPGLGIKILPELLVAIAQAPDNNTRWLTGVLKLMAQTDPQATSARLLELNKIEIHSAWIEPILNAFKDLEKKHVVDCHVVILDKIKQAAASPDDEKKDPNKLYGLASLIPLESAEAWLISELQTSPNEYHIYLTKTNLAKRYQAGITHETGLTPLNPQESLEYSVIFAKLQTLEMLNGLIAWDGMTQYLISRPRSTWEEFHQALEMIGAHQSAQSCQELLDTFAPAMSNNPNENSDQVLKQIQARIGDRYYRLEEEISGKTSGENFAVLAAQYVIDRRDLFLRGRIKA